MATAREKIAEMVRRARGDMSKSDFARLLGVTHTSIHNWENGITQPDTRSFLQLGKMLGYGVEELLAILDNVTVPQTPKLPELISTVRKLRDKESLYRVSEAVNQQWLSLT